MSVWVNHSKGGDPVALLNALRRDFGGIRLGVAALGASKLLSEDPPRFLSALPPNTTVSVGVGDLRELPAGTSVQKAVEKALAFAQASKQLGFKTLIAAQGPRMLTFASRFDGAMLSFLRPGPVRYAKTLVGGAELYGTAPSLVYLDGFTVSEHRELIKSAKYVFEGASLAIRRLFPKIDDYYVKGSVEEVAQLMVELGELGLHEAILAHPQTMNQKLIAHAHSLLQRTRGL